MKTTNHFRSSSMEDLNAEIYKKQESNNALSSLKKNLREELNSMVMMPQDSEEEYQFVKFIFIIVNSIDYILKLLFKVLNLNFYLY